MTALCPGGGASAPKFGTSAVTLLASGALAVILDKYGAGWLKWALPFLSLPELTVSSFCAADPPAIPTFSSAESQALIKFTLGSDFDSALTKFAALLQHLAWYELCQCITGTATALPAAPAPPAGTPVYSPSGGETAVRCGTNTIGGQLDNTIYPGGLSTQWSGAVPTPITSARITVFTAHNVAPGVSITFQVQFTRADGSSFVSPAFVRGPDTALTSQDVTVPLGTTRIDLLRTPNNAAGNTQYTMTVDVYCNGQVPGGVGCCIDPTIDIRLDAIMRMVTLIQRQAVPFGYVSGAVHAGLSGAGSFAIAGLLGAKVDLTTTPAQLGVSGSTPPKLFDAGYVTFGTPDGYPHSYRLEHDPQLILPARAGGFTTLAYDLHPGVVVTITELLREP